MAEKSVCAVAGCDKPLYRYHNMCQGHVRRVQRLGHPLSDVPLGGIVRQRKDLNWLEAHKNWVGDDCLPWPFRRSARGYPQMQDHKGHTVIASRVMCRAVHGEPPSPDHQAAHSCGKGHEGCVNPKHLRWATPAENYSDRRRHLTDDVGERNPRVKLTEAIVREIRSLPASVTNASLGRKYGLALNSIRSARVGLNWKHVK